MKFPYRHVHFVSAQKFVENLRKGEEREVYGCVCALTGGRRKLMGGFLCVKMCVCLVNWAACWQRYVCRKHVCAFVCLFADVGPNAWELLACKNESGDTERR